MVSGADGALPPSPKSIREMNYSGPGWNLLQRIAFRVCFIYLLLYILPFPIDDAMSLYFQTEALIKTEILKKEDEEPSKEPPLVQKYVLKPYADAMEEVVVWTGQKVFKTELDYRPLGSGDTKWNYVQVFCFAAIAVGGAILWSGAAGAWRLIRKRSRLGYPHLHEWLRVYVRFYLAQMMFSYGFAKVIKLQFAFPGPSQMMETYGESSPMRILWTFMGASDEYTWFTGAGEVLAGVLLCTRRTALLGSLVTFGVMVHVAALNFSYDVPVKLLSSHLALFSVFLMAPSIPWLAKVFILGWPTAPKRVGPLVPWPWLDWALFAYRSMIVLLFVGIAVYSGLESSKLYGRSAPKPPMYGVWDVEEFTLDDKVRPPLTTDAGRWQRVLFNKAVTFNKKVPPNATLSITNMQGKMAGFFNVKVDEEAKTITLSRPSFPGQTKEPESFVWTYAPVAEDVIEAQGTLPMFADGTFGPKRIRVRLHHYGEDKFLLSGRGFHWINEVPYNRFSPHTEPFPPLPPPPKKKD